MVAVALSHQLHRTPLAPFDVFTLSRDSHRWPTEWINECVRRNAVIFVRRTVAEPTISFHLYTYASSGREDKSLETLLPNPCQQYQMCLVLTLTYVCVRGLAGNRSTPYSHAAVCHKITQRAKQRAWAKSRYTFPSQLCYFRGIGLYSIIDLSQERSLAIQFPSGRGLEAHWRTLHCDAHDLENTPLKKGGQRRETEVNSSWKWRLNLRYQQILQTIWKLARLSS